MKREKIPAKILKKAEKQMSTIFYHKHVDCDKVNTFMVCFIQLLTTKVE